MFGLADIDLNIVGFGIFSDDHTGIYLFTGSDEEGSAFLRAVQAVCDRFSG